MNGDDEKRIKIYEWLQRHHLKISVKLEPDEHPKEAEFAGPHACRKCGKWHGDKFRVSVFRNDPAGIAGCLRTEAWTSYGAKASGGVLRVEDAVESLWFDASVPDFERWCQEDRFRRDAGSERDHRRWEDERAAAERVRIFLGPEAVRGLEKILGSVR